ncbi:MAG: DEAD/DEAH box helicase family protein, partial [Rhodobacteraceae bacterium]|nr:DEAD/DEAH box helicase family protein [Paracoccaceae bacterium]
MYGFLSVPATQATDRRRVFKSGLNVASKVALAGTDRPFLKRLHRAWKALIMANDLEKYASPLIPSQDDTQLPDFSEYGQPLDIEQPDPPTSAAPMAAEAPDFSEFGQPLDPPPAPSPQPTTPAQATQATDYGDFLGGLYRSATSTNVKLAGHTFGAISDLNEGSEYDKNIDEIIGWGDALGEGIAPAKFDKIQDAWEGGLGDLTDWAQNAAGEAIGSSFTSIVGGIAGGAAGGKLFKGAGAKKAGRTLGAAGGAFMGSALLNVGSMRQTLIEEGVTDRKQRGRWAMAGGAAMAGLDSILPARVTSKLTGPLRDQLEKTIARRLMKEVVKSAGQEGLTEAAQETLEYSLGKYVSGNKVDLNEVVDLALNSFAAGFVGGAAIGGGGEIAKSGAETVNRALKGDLRTKETRSTRVEPTIKVPGQQDALAAPETIYQPGPETDLATYMPSGQPPATVTPAGRPTSPVEVNDAAQQPPLRIPPPASRQIPPPAAPTDDFADSGIDLEVFETLEEQGYSHEQIAGMNELERQGAIEEAVEAGAAPPSGDGEKRSSHEWMQDPDFDWQILDPDGWDRRDLDASMSEPITKAEFNRRVTMSTIRPKPAPQPEGTRAKPVPAQTSEDIEPAREQVEPEPTEAQKEAGNYKKGHIKWNGLDITIENPVGSERSGTDSSGKPWSVQMPADYGYVKRTEGADGDQVDIYMGPSPDSDAVFVVDQNDPATNKFDEHKAILGVNSAEEAQQLYNAGFSDNSGPSRFGGMRQMTAGEFKDWLRNGDTTKPTEATNEEAQTDVPAGTELADRPGAQTGAQGTAQRPATGPEAAADPGVPGDIEPGDARTPESGSATPQGPAATNTDSLGDGRSRPGDGPSAGGDQAGASDSDSRGVGGEALAGESADRPRRGVHEGGKGDLDGEPREPGTGRTSGGRLDGGPGGPGTGGTSGGRPGDRVQIADGDQKSPEDTGAKAETSDVGSRRGGTEAGGRKPASAAIPDDTRKRFARYLRGKRRLDPALIAANLDTTSRVGRQLIDEAVEAGTAHQARDGSWQRGPGPAELVDEKPSTAELVAAQETAEPAAEKPKDEYVPTAVDLLRDKLKKADGISVDPSYPTLQNSDEQSSSRALSFPMSLDGPSGRMVMGRKKEGGPELTVFDPQLLDMPFVKKVEKITGLKATVTQRAQKREQSQFYHGIDLATDSGFQELLDSMELTTPEKVARGVAVNLHRKGRLSTSNARKLLAGAGLPELSKAEIDAYLHKTSIIDGKDEKGKPRQFLNFHSERDGRNDLAAYGMIEAIDRGWVKYDRGGHLHAQKPFIDFVAGAAPKEQIAAAQEGARNKGSFLTFSDEETSSAPTSEAAKSVERQAEDSDEVVTQSLTKTGPWDFNDTYPASLPGKAQYSYQDGREVVESTIEALESSISDLTGLNRDLYEQRQAADKDAVKATLRDIKGIRDDWRTTHSAEAVAAIINQGRKRAQMERATAPGPRVPPKDPKTDAEKKVQKQGVNRTSGPKTLTAFLKSLGGIKEEGGELASRDIRRQRPGLLNNASGMTLEEATQQAVDAGYLIDQGNITGGASEVTYDDLLQLLDEELGGNPVYPVGLKPVAAAGPSRSPREEDMAADYGDKFAAAAMELEAETGISVDDYSHNQLLRAAELVNEGELIDNAIERALYEDVTEATSDQDDFNADDIEAAFGHPPTAEDTRQGGEKPSQAEIVEAGSQPDTDAGQDGPQAGSEEVGADGRPQTVLPGAERIPDKEHAERLGDKPMRGTAQQQEPGGLFGPERDQLDLVDMAKTPKARAPIAPQSKQKGQAASKVAKLLHELGLAEAIMEGSDFHARIENPPYMDLVIERLPHDDGKGGQMLSLAHYVEQNGDLINDGEMTWTITVDGKLELYDVIPAGMVRGQRPAQADQAFARMFAGNLINQGFHKVVLGEVDGRAEDEVGRADVHRAPRDREQEATQEAVSDDQAEKKDSGAENAKSDEIMQDPPKITGQHLDRLVKAFAPPNVSSAIDRAYRPRKKVVKSAARNVAKGIAEAAEGLSALFIDPNKVGTGPSFDEETYQRALPHFRKAAAHFKDAAHDIGELLNRMIQSFADAGMAREAVETMSPYLERYIVDVANGKENPNAPGQQPSVESDLGTGTAADGLGETGVSTVGDGSGRGSAEGGSAPDQGAERPVTIRGVSPGDAASLGEPGYLELHREEPEPETGPAERGDDRGGDSAGVEGLPDSRVSAKETAKSSTSTADVKERQAAQAAAEVIGVVDGDLDNIRQTLPMLFPKQQEDVHKIEKRFQEPNAHGMLITNGTGTGKTFSGLGVVKRMAKQGKTNQLMVAPSQGILQNWLTSGKMMGLDISVLGSTQDAGTGLVATTYANLGENRHLADRDFDFVLADEAHKLSSNAQGENTSALETFRAITNHPRGLHTRAYHQLRDQVDKHRALVDRATAAVAGKHANAVDLSEKAQQSAEALNEAVKAKVTKFKQQERPKALFMSATPFAYHFSLDYAEGYLFDYPSASGDRYNSGDGRDQFFMENFGYRMRYNKLTKPEADVNSEIMERQFHEKLKKAGALAGRALDVEKDYDRKFVLIESKIGAQIDKALDFLMQAEKGRYRPLHDAIMKKFDYLSRQRLLEAIKAREAIPYLKKSFELGRKAVVFHDYNEGGGFNPFELVIDPSEEITKIIDGKPKTENVAQLYADFVRQNPEVMELQFSDYLAPIDELSQAFGSQAGIYNGTVSNNERKKSLDAFNTDGSGVDLLIVQSAAGEFGLSMHDISNVHQRVMLNLGMPTRPTSALQQEGRIYREGQMSDALFRYMSTGTAWERSTFASKIAERAGTAENLALGNLARTIRQAFVEAYQDADTYAPEPGEGTGGKAADRALNEALSDWDVAKTYYFAQAKKKGRRDQREGADYFATPEPVGLKMVELADPRPAEKMLEPSAGHGAISRFFPETSDRTIVEPSFDLSTKAQLNTPGTRAIVERFEDLNIVNKYDGIVMNPPFGSGGRTAIDHLEKATRHLRNGGRIVALIPTGPAADKKFDAFYEEVENVYKVADIKMPAVTFERAGTKVAARIVVLERQNDVASQQAMPPQQVTRDYTNVEKINELFDRIEHLEIPPRTEPQTKDLDIGDESTVTIDGVKWDIQDDPSGQIRVKPLQFLDRGAFRASARLAERNGGAYDKTSRAFKFDTAEQRMAFLADLRSPPAEPAAPSTAESAEHAFDLAETVHAKTGKNLFVATIRDRVERDEYNRILEVAKKNGGYYSSFRRNNAIPGFQFPSEATRQAFVDEITGKPTEAPLAQLSETPATPPVPGFFSPLLVAAENLKQEKGRADQFLAVLKKTPGVKPDELLWTGTEDWLQEKGSESITRQEVESFIRANQVRIEEVELGAPSETKVNLSSYQDDIPDDGFFKEQAEDMYLEAAREQIAHREGIEPSEVDEGWALEYATNKAREEYEPTSSYMNGTVTIGENSFDFTVNYDSLDEYMEIWSADWPGQSDQIYSGDKLDNPQIERLVAQEYADALDIDLDEDGARFEGWTLHGGSNYREVLLTLPAEQFERSRTDDPYEQIPFSDRFHSAHYDQENIVAHARLKDREARDGKRILFVEEIQSDWHQTGRDERYKSDLRAEMAPHLQTIAEAKRELEALGVSALGNEYVDARSGAPLNPEAYWSAKDAMLKHSLARSEIALLQGVRSVPDAPWKQTDAWAGLTFRNILREAVEKGYDKIGWTTGEQQAERYNLSRSIHSAQAWIEQDREFIKLRSRSVDLHIVNGGHVRLGFNDEGIVTTSPSGFEEMQGKPLSEVIGRELATQVMAAPDGTTFDAMNIEIGGEGMRHFYDKMLPRMVNKLVKKWGGKVSTEPIKLTDMPWTEYEGQNRSTAYVAANRPTVWSLDITPAMRESVAATGVPLFERRQGTVSRETQITDFAKRQKVQNDLLSMSNKILGHGLFVQFTDNMEPGHEGSYYPTAKLIKVALDAADPKRTFNHEAIHALRDIGVITKREWNTLATSAQAHWMEHYQTLERYERDYAQVFDLSPGQLHDLFVEEAIADAFSDYMANKDSPHIGIAARIFERLADLFERVRNYLKGEGFMSTGSVFESIRSGEVAGRDRYSGEARRFKAGRRQPVASLRRTTPPFQPPTEMTVDAWRRHSADPILARVGKTLETTIVEPRRLLQDRIIDLQRFQDAIANGDPDAIQESMDAYMATNLFYGRAGKRLDDMRFDFIEPIIEVINRADLSLVNVDEYLYARHAKERNAEIARINPKMPDGGSGITDAEADQMMAEFDAAGQIPALRQVAEIVDSMIYETRRDLLKAGLITQGTFDEWTNAYNHYVPLRGWENDAEAQEEPGLPMIGRRFDIRGQEARMAMGRKTKADSPLAYVIAQMQQAQIRAEKNRVAKTFLRLVQQNPNKDVWEIVKHDDPDMRDRPITKRRLNKSTGLVEEVFDQNYKNRDDIYSIKIGGREQ